MMRRQSIDSGILVVQVTQEFSEKEGGQVPVVSEERSLPNPGVSF